MQLLERFFGWVEAPARNEAIQRLIPNVPHLRELIEHSKDPELRAAIDTFSQQWQNFKPRDITFKSFQAQLSYEQALAERFPVHGYLKGSKPPGQDQQAYVTDRRRGISLIVPPDLSRHIQQLELDGEPEIREALREVAEKGFTLACNEQQFHSECGRYDMFLTPTGQDSVFFAVHMGIKDDQPEFLVTRQTNFHNRPSKTASRSFETFDEFKGAVTQALISFDFDSLLSSQRSS